MQPEISFGFEVTPALLLLRREVVQISQKGCHIPIYVVVEGKTELVKFVFSLIWMLAIDRPVYIVDLVSEPRIVPILLEYLKAKRAEIQLGCSGAKR
ncbi:hypothetical protein [Mesorhizobium abyssinicae]|uniref:hypothetical protein n=1 Tax=Mesorhizobium abyssinicae TaxID=1209958 RepID=UPI003398F3CC